MKLHLERAAEQYQFTGYGDGWVAINGERHTQALLLLPDRVVAPWLVEDDIDRLTMEHFAALAQFRPDIVLLGTGRRFRLPGSSLMRAFNADGVGLEAMDTHAACRTFNVLLAEGRQVAAALLAV